MHPKESDIIFCHLCTYKTPDNRCLKKHIAMVHEKIKRFACDQCDRKFYQNSFLTQHVKIDHLGELNYKCDMCDLKFKRLADKKKHIRIDHLDEKYPCVICGKEYLSYNTMAKHLRKFHNGLTKRKLDAMEKEIKMEEKKQKLG